MADETAVIDPSERIAELEADLADRDARIEELSPTKDVTQFFFETEQDVVAFLGEDRIKQMVEERYAFENRRRQRDSLYPLPHEGRDGKKVRDGFRADIIRERLSDAQATFAPSQGILARTLKMVRPDGQLIQIPYEVQVNNVAGSLADGYVKYERKGFKRTEPMLCPSVDCYLPAATGDKGKWRWHSYCSEDHFKRTERGAAIPE